MQLKRTPARSGAHYKAIDSEWAAEACSMYVVFGRSYKAYVNLAAVSTL